MTKEIGIIGKGRYAVAPHQQFTDRTGNLVRVVKGQSAPVPVGKAYAFFDCEDSREAIEGELPIIRSLAKTPSELELSLTEGFDQLQGDSQIAGIAREAKEAGMNYILEARYPTASNLTTADELSSVLNQMYQSPLYPNGGKFRGAIFYKDKDQYVSRD